MRDATETAEKKISRIRPKANMRTDRSTEHRVSRDFALFTDLYEFTMVQTYFEEGMMDGGVFSLFVRWLPNRRNFLLACGIDIVLDYLETFSFSDDDVAYISSRTQFYDLPVTTAGL